MIDLAVRCWRRREFSRAVASSNNSRPRAIIPCIRLRKKRHDANRPTERYLYLPLSHCEGKATPFPADPSLRNSPRDGIDSRARLFNTIAAQAAGSPAAFIGVKET
jgi:hypothetical protein